MKSQGGKALVLGITHWRFHRFNMNPKTQHHCGQDPLVTSQSTANSLNSIFTVSMSKSIANLSCICSKVAKVRSLHSDGSRSLKKRKMLDLKSNLDINLFTKDS